MNVFPDSVPKVSSLNIQSISFISLQLPSNVLWSILEKSRLVSNTFNATSCHHFGPATKGRVSSESKRDVFMGDGVTLCSGWNHFCRRATFSPKGKTLLCSTSLPCIYFYSCTCSLSNV